MSSSGSARWMLAAPLLVFFLAFFVTPIIVLILYSLHLVEGVQAGTMREFAAFLTDPFYLGVLFRTLILGVKTTAVCLLFAFPLSWLIAQANGWKKTVLMFIVILPILTSVVVRTFSWIVILGNQGIVNTTLVALGIIDAPLRLLFTETAVIVVLAQVLLPLMVLPILTTLGRIDPNLTDASAVLGAGKWRTFWRITVPLSLSGVITGCILVFATAITAFVTHTLIGGARLLYMPLAIYQQAVGANNWTFAAAISIIFTISVVAIVYSMEHLATRTGVQR